MDYEKYKYVDESMVYGKFSVSLEQGNLEKN